MLSSPAQRSACLAFFMFASGFCSLAYQIVWLREFRLVFGGSTLAASAVLAIFMGALGLGSWVLGHKADQSSRPGRFYAIIEALIGLSVLISPLLLIYGQKLYYTTGGIQELGWVAVGLQMLIAIAVIATPCFLMGGTLPAAIRLVQTDEDEVRRSSALMYGMNIAGAVLGAFIVNFYCLEVLGNTTSLLMAAGLNLLLAAVAYYTVAMHQAPQAPTSNGHEKHGTRLAFIFRRLFQWFHILCHGIALVQIIRSSAWWICLQLRPDPDRGSHWHEHGWIALFPHHQIRQTELRLISHRLRAFCHSNGHSLHLG